MIHSICQLNIDWLNPKSNLKKMERAIAQAANEGSQVITFPEMSLSGFCMDTSKTSIEESSIEFKTLAALSREYKIAIVAGIAIKGDSGFYNNACVFSEGKTIYRYSKHALFRPAKEHENYSAGKEIENFSLHGVVMTARVCYDLRFPELFLTSQEPKAYFVLANWPESRDSHWVTLLKARALDTQAFIIGVNRSGKDEFTYRGKSCIVNPQGEFVIEPFEGEGFRTAQLDFKQAEAFRRQIPLQKTRELLHFRVK